MAHRTEYKSVRFRDAARVQAGKTRQEIEAIGGVRLIRVTDDGRDDLFVVSPGMAQVDVPWSNVASATRAPEVVKEKATK
jgi:hypothetical protein